MLKKKFNIPNLEIENVSSSTTINNMLTKYSVLYNPTMLCIDGIADIICSRENRSDEMSLMSREINDIIDTSHVKKEETIDIQNDKSNEIHSEGMLSYLYIIY